MTLKQFSYVAIWFLAYAIIAASYANPLHDNNPFCRSTSAFDKHLQRYNEEKVWSGSSNGTLYEVYSSIDGLIANKITQEGATWTVDYATSDGRKCLVATGVQWRGTSSSRWRVQKAPISKNEKGSAGEESQNLGDDGLSDYAIGNTRLHLVGSCNNGYSLDKVVTTNPFVIGEGRIEVGSDRLNKYTLSVHHADHLFILSSSPTSTTTDAATWAMLFPLPVPNEAFTVWGCTYIEAVGSHGQRSSHRSSRAIPKKPEFKL